MWPTLTVDGGERHDSEDRQQDHQRIAERVEEPDRPPHGTLRGNLIWAIDREPAFGLSLGEALECGVAQPERIVAIGAGRLLHAPCIPPSGG
jgi:hypothetical protein